MRIGILIIFIVIMAGNALAVQDKIGLLTVTGVNSTIGGTAEVSLELRHGSGRIFLDSYPLSQLDTQISTRFAKEMACSFLDVDCSDIDFFYTIRASTGVIGGPSAGGALTVLTVALLDNQELDKTVAMTGTINSGGTIGSVGGIPAKVKAAADKGFETVIIPKFSGENITSDIEVIEVTNIEEALLVFTGKNYDNNYTLQKYELYDQLMEQVAQEICAATETFMANGLDKNTSEYNASDYYYNLSKEAIITDDYYSAASYCFSSNIRLRGLSLKDSSNLKDDLRVLKEKITSFDSKLDSKKLTSLSELETFMIVKERLLEAREVADELDETNISYQLLAYGIERFNSAVTWSKFFGLESKPIDLDSEHLESACINKLNEADERNNYVRLINPLFDNEELDGAYNSKDDGDYIMCLFKATKSKAEINSLIDAIGTDVNQTDELVDSKLNSAQKVIAKQQSKDQFPILGYSYYQYANSLKIQDSTNALIFSQYALEFSNLDVYFPVQRKKPVVYEELSEDEGMYKWLTIGFISGIVAVLLVLLIIGPGKNSPKKAPPRKKR